MRHSSRGRKSLGLALLIILGVVAPVPGRASGSYTYDQGGRLTTALYANGTCVAYTYDANGNRTLQNATMAGPPESPTWGSGVWGCFQWTSQ